MGFQRWLINKSEHEGAEVLLWNRAPKWSCACLSNPVEISPQQQQRQNIHKV